MAMGESPGKTGENTKIIGGNFGNEKSFHSFAIRN